MHEGRRQREAGFYEGRTERERSPAVKDRLVELALSAQCDREIVVRIGITRAEPQGLAKASVGFFVAAKTTQDVSEIVVSVGEIGLQAQCVLVLFPRGVTSSQSRHDVAELVPHDRVVGPDPYRGQERFGGILEAAVANRVETKGLVTLEIVGGVAYVTAASRGGSDAILVASSWWVEDGRMFMDRHGGYSGQAFSGARSEITTPTPATQGIVTFAFEKREVRSLPIPRRTYDVSAVGQRDRVGI
jgi:hypothetical protein